MPVMLFPGGNLFKEVWDQASLTNLSQGLGIFESSKNADISNS